MEARNDSFFSEMVRFALITLAIVVPIRFFVAEPFIVSGSSMSPTFETGHYLIIDQLSYEFNAPKRGEVVIFHYPNDPKKYFIKRIVGLPGESVEINGANVIIKNKNNPEGFTLSEEYILNKSVGNGVYVVSENEYFVMGDNRGASSDSRVWGPLKKDLIVGKAFLRLFPPKDISYLPGDKSK